MEKTFAIVSGLVNLSDPCYEVGTWCGEYNVPAKNGNWTVRVQYSDEGSWGIRVAGWEAFSEGHEYDVTVPLSTDFGVDSGQFGIFDASIYENTEYGEPGFYNDCCNVTLDDPGMCGVIPNGLGFVSRTGYGDGGYDGYAAYENGTLVKFGVVFISDETDDEDDEE